MAANCGTAPAVTYSIEYPAFRSRVPVMWAEMCCPVHSLIGIRIGSAESAHAPIVDAAASRAPAAKVFRRFIWHPS